MQSIPQPRAGIRVAAIVLAGLAALTVVLAVADHAEAQAGVAVRTFNVNDPTVGVPKRMFAEVENTETAAVQVRYAFLYNWSRGAADIECEVGSDPQTCQAPGFQTPTQTATLQPGLNPLESVLWSPDATRAGDHNFRLEVQTLAGNASLSIRNVLVKLYRFDVDPRGKLVGAIDVNVEPGNTVSIPVEIANTGNSLISIDLNATIRSKSPEDRNWITFVIPSVTEVQPGQNRTVTAQVTAPADARSGDEVLARLNARARQATGPADTVDLPRVLVKIVTKFQRDIRLVENVSFQQADPDSSVLYRFNVTNAGNANDTIFLQGAELPPNWAIVFAGDRVADDRITSLHPGENATVFATVRVDPRALALNHTVVVRGVSENDTFESDSLILKTNVSQAFGVNLDPGPVRALGIDPGRLLALPLTVTNTGNGNDTMRLFRSVLASSWQGRFSEDLVTLGGYDTRTVWFNVTTPEAEPAGTVVDLTVNLTSTIHLPANVSIPLRLTVRTAHFFTLAADTNATFVDPGKTFATQVRADSDANVPLNVTLSIVDRAETRGRAPATDAWTVNLTTSTVAMKPSEQRFFSLSVKAPPDGVVGDSLRFRLRGVPLENGTVVFDVPFEVRISGPDLNVSRVDLPGLVFRGDNVTLRANVRNLGNKPLPAGTVTKVDFSALPSATTVSRFIATVEIPNPGAGSSQVAEATWRTSDLSGDVTIIATVAALRNDVAVEEASATNNEMRVPATVRVFSLLLEAPTFEEALLPGQEVRDAEFVVSNGGTHRETVQVQVLSPHGFAPAFGIRTIALDPLTTDVLRGTIRVPAEPGTVKETLTFRVSHALRPDLVAERTFDVRVDDRVPPRIVSFATTSVTALPGEALVFEAEVRDDTVVRDVEARIITPKGEEVRRTLLSDDGIRFRGNRTFGDVGDYRWFVVTTDLSGNQNNTQSSPKSFAVRVGSAPVIALVSPPNGSALQSGTPVRLNVTDPLGVLVVRYTSGALSDVVSAPYAIQTSRFPEGVHVIDVQATNTFNNTSTASFRFTFDNTPPVIEDLVLGKESPKEGEPLPFTVTVRDANGVAGVELIVKEGDREIERVQLRRAGSTGFQGEFTPPAGTLTLQLVARDAAGNAQTLTDEVEVEGGLLPAPGVVAVIGAAAAVAVARRRGRRRG